MNKPKLWTKDFVMVCLTNLFLSMNFYLLMVIFSEYAVKKFNASQSLAGLASSIFVIGALVARPLTGKYIDLIGRKKLIYSSIVIFIVTTVLYFQINSITLLLVDRFLHGASLGVAATVIATIMTSSIPRERSGEGIGYFSMSVTIATAVGPFVALIVVQRAGYNMAFLMCVIFAVIAFVLSLFLRIPKVTVSKEQRESLKGFKFSDFFEISALPMALIMVILGFTYSSVISFMSSFANEANLSGAASVFFLVYALLLLASRPFTGRRFDLKGGNSIIYPCLILYLIGMLVLSQSYNGFVLLLAGALIGIGFGTTMSGVQTVIVKKAPPHRVGLANSTFFVSFDLGLGVGPFVLGSFLPSLGYRGMYIAMAVIALICIVLYYFIHGKKAANLKKYHNAI